MKRDWVNAVAALFLTAGWAAAQASYSSPRPDPGTPDPDIFGALLQPPGGVATSRDGPDNSPPPYRVWASADFLAWEIPNAHLPALASTLPVGVIVADTTNEFRPPLPPPALQTIPNFAPVSIESAPTFADGNTLRSGVQLGARLSAGVWLNPEETFGLDTSFFFISNRTTGFHSSTGNSLDQFLLNFPFNSNVFVQTTTTTATTPPTTTTTTTLLQSFPTFVVRQTSANLLGTSSKGMWGGEINARCVWDPADAKDPFIGYQVSGLAGFRYLDFHENLDVVNAVQLFLPPGFQDVNGLGQPLNTNLPTNISYSTADGIRTGNQFYGGQVGIDCSWYLAQLLGDISIKAGLGVMHQTVDILGTIQMNGTSTPGGLLSSPLDQGPHGSNRIAVVPEIDAKLGYQILPSLRAFIGYDFLFLSSVVRPGDQVGLSSSNIQASVAGTTSQISVSQPTFRSNTTTLTVNGINFGMEFRY